MICKRILLYCLVLIIGLNLLCANTARSQTISTVKIDLEVKSKTLKEVFQIIEQKSGLHFIYNEDLVSVYSNISISGTGRTVSSVLNELLSKTNLWYIEQNNRIIIEKKNPVPVDPPETKIINGKILEAGTDKPVKNASIYFDGTLNGTSSDSTGNFTLYPQRNRQVPVIVNAVGYDTETIKDFPAGKKVIVYLNVRQYDLEAVTISASDGMSRKEKLRIFRTEFLGTSANARSCEIVNENDIRLSYNRKTKTIKAFSDKPIIVRNKKLGYTLNFLPKDLTFSPNRIMVQGYQFFEEDPVLSKDVKIQKAREATYLGSQIHFIRSLWNDDLKKNDFKISHGSFAYRGNTIVNTYDNNSNQTTYDSIVITRNGDKYIHLEGGMVSIDYKGRKSFVNTIIAGEAGLISKSGYSDPTALVWSGFIGTQRIGDALPLEYKGGEISSEPEPVMDVGVKGIIASADTLRSRMPAEKLYIQFDKPYYSTGDTIRLKAYLLDAAFLSASRSGLVYLELANDTNKVLMRRMLPLVSGIGYGNLVLDTVDIPDGSYTIRAYTNLMRNFGEDLVFKKSFYVSRSSAQSWLVNSRSMLFKQAGKDHLRLDLQLNQFNKEALRMQNLELRILEGKRVLLRDKVQTDVDGKLDVNFNLPEKADATNISVVAVDPKDDSRKLTIPVIINRSENIDLQFMPEGGNLIAGISAVIGFKAIGEDGHGTEVAGKIYNSKNEEKGVFNSLYKGMGSFEFLPQAGESYTAKILLPDGASKIYPLPEIKTSGTALKIGNSKNSDTLNVIVILSPGLSGTYYLIGQSRGIVCYGAIIRQSDIKKIPKSLFPSGIARFTLLNADRQPLNERIAYIDHKDNLNITVSPAKESFGKRDSVALNILVRDKDNQPVQGSFSLAVTDDNQVKTDSLGSTILTTLLLTSDLKGNVEGPGHYFQATDKAWKDLDNLLLTQGWVAYTWKDVFNPPVPQYAAESQFTVQGKVTNVFNKGVPETGIMLTSIRPLIIKDTLTRKDGSFTFNDLPLSDTLSFFIQAKNKNNKSFNVGLEVDEFKPPVYTSANLRLLPWYVNTDTLLLKYVSTIAEQKQEELKLQKGTNVLSEVVITAKKIIKGSRNLNGAGNADIILDEKDMAHYRNLTLYELLVKRFKYIYTTRVNGIAIYKYMQRRIVFVIDGVPASPPESYMENITAEDIKGIEIMDSFNYIYPTYITKFEVAWKIQPYIFILEITTRSGHGAFAYMKNIPGTYWYRPMLFTSSKQFYSPKYTVKSPITLTDLRSTIHWAPNIVTDKEGKAFVSFYSADKVGSYSVIMEGSDMNGNIGRQTGTITIK